ncbi:hypothetical protein CEUSTIGMA_g11898.t1 [Chlamydomonas eustigma]|uniref:Peptidase M11 gametolysin domain-containing protein n=1 Tax=Chlamydomonas eustigma TaxID=1157962 RepID=A0A250XN30_9CHLO|nr:hypothetical protein CEUSTIGMA_g11898.t1 [Chlamydomonas eustigma]|eukprot:GAX84478.1 hypothetical protein CEUSTIGMA_g11898.t1 [Chlamydomonas eustigma]
MDVNGLGAIVNVPSSVPAYGFANQGCPPPICYTWISALRTLQSSPPFLNSCVHELGHTLNLVHAGTSTWDYGDCASPMGCASTQATCHSATNARQIGYATAVADLQLHEMPLGKWIGYGIPVMTVSNRNHITVSFGQAVVFLSARSSTASKKGADKGLAGSAFDGSILIEGTFPYLSGTLPHTWLLKTLRPGQSYDLRAAGSLAVDVMAGVNFSAPLQCKECKVLFDRQCRQRMEGLGRDLLRGILSLLTVHENPWAVCKAWSTLTLSSPDVMARILANSTSTPVLILVKRAKRELRTRKECTLLDKLLELPRSALDKDMSIACTDAIRKGATSTVHTLLTRRLLTADFGEGSGLVIASDTGNVDMVRMLIEWPEHAPRADSQYGKALVFAARNGHLEIVRLLLEWPEHAPRADCRYGAALVLAAWNGHLDVVRMLLEWPEHAPRADCWGGEALLSARNGHIDIVCLLLEWPEHAPRADCRDGLVLVCAACYGHLDVVRLLLEWPEHAPRADSLSGRALIEAASNGHGDMARLLLGWPLNAPRADSLSGRALIEAASNGHVDIVKLLLEWPVNAPRADCQNGLALIEAASNGHVDIVKLLLEWPVNAPRADCQNGLALIEAASNGHVDIVKLLLECEPEDVP